jgi:FtsH-binding integral membrane protein
MPGVPLTSALRGPRRAFQFDRRRLRWPEWVAAASAIVLLIVLFVMNWFTLRLVSGGAGTKYIVPDTVNGWDSLSHLRWLLLITAIGALILFVLQATRRSPALPVTLSLVLPLLGGVSVIWVFVRVAISPPGGRCPGGWVGLAAAAVLTWGAFRSLRMEGIAPTDAPAHIPTVQLTEGEDPRPPTQGDSPR